MFQDLVHQAGGFYCKDQLAKSCSHFGKSICEGPIRKIFFKGILRGAVATGVKLGNFPKERTVKIVLK